MRTGRRGTRAANTSGSSPRRTSRSTRRGWTCRRTTGRRHARSILRSCARAIRHRCCRRATRRRRPPRPERPDSSAVGTRTDSGPSRADRAPRVAAVRIDFDGLQQRIIAIPGIAQRNYTQLRSGPAGTVFFIEPIPPTGTQEPVPGGGFGGAPAGVLHRYQLKDRKAAQFAQGVVQFVVSADGHKLLYRTPGQQGGLYLVDADRMIPTAGQGRLTTQLRAYVDPKAEFKQ